MVRLAVATRGSRITGMLFETASKPGIRAGAQRIGVQQQGQHAQQAEARDRRCPSLTSVGDVAAPRRRPPAGASPIEPTISTTCVSRNSRKIGIRTWTDSFTPRRFSTISTTMAANSACSFQCDATRAQQAEQGVAGRGDRDGDRQHVVDQQRTARDHADPLPEQLRGHQVSAAAAGKLLDDVAVAGRDDEHRGDDRQGEEHGQVAMLARGWRTPRAGRSRTTTARRPPVPPRPGTRPAKRA